MTETDARSNLYGNPVFEALENSNFEFISDFGFRASNFKLIYSSDTSKDQ